MNYKERCEMLHQDPHSPLGHAGGYWKCPKCGATSRPFDPDIMDEPGEDWADEWTEMGHVPNCPECGYPFPTWTYGERVEKGDEKEK